MIESWKPVVGFETSYEVSNFGNVRSLDRVQSSYGGRTWIKRGKVMQPAKQRYWVITLTGAINQSTRFYIHELVLKAFIGKRPDGMQGCHNDGNVDNNNLENLRWDTPTANSLDKIKHKTIAAGVTHGMNKYSENQIKDVCSLIAQGKTNDDIELLTKVKKATVQQIRKGRQWKSIGLKSSSHR